MTVSIGHIGELLPGLWLSQDLALAATQFGIQ